jgi:FtsP/CotA-like multicopper oxidase with cupredoxin domain
VNEITQCPMAPKHNFIYNFTLPQYGSSWYHSHYSVQYTDGAAGPITIYGPSSANWDEAISPPLIMTDWFHNTAFQVASWVDTIGGDILLNSRGNITSGVNNTKSALTINFESNRPGQGSKKYLLRIINASYLHLQHRQPSHSNR